MTKKPSSIAEYISWLLKQYNEIKKQTPPPTLYRLVETKEKDDGQYCLSFQVIGKATIFKTTPEKVLKNETAIELFSSKDINTINQLVYRNLSAPKNKIIGKVFSGEINALVFKIESGSNHSINEKTASILSRDNNFIKNLSPQDAHTIGYAAAQEESEKEKVMINAIRKDRKTRFRAIKNIFFNRNSTTFLKIQRKGYDFMLEVSGLDILKDKETLNSLSPVDAAVVGYFAAQEAYAAEKEVMNALRQNKKFTQKIVSPVKP